VYQVVSSAAGQQPAPADQLVGQRVDRGMGGALPVDAHLRAGQRIQPVRVGPVLGQPGVVGLTSMIMLVCGW
jgi:hypothetical protein